MVELFKQFVQSKAGDNEDSGDVSPQTFDGVGQDELLKLECLFDVEIVVLCL